MGRSMHLGKSLMVAAVLTAACGTISLPDTAWAFDEFDTAYAPQRFTLKLRDFTLEIKGRARLGLHDLEGDGGPEYDSPTDTATIGTRSPFVELDSFDLALRLNWMETLWLNTNISFLTDTTALSAIYFEYRGEIDDMVSHGAEVGYLSSVVATDRHTVRYPLIAAAYWKNPEYHAAYGVKVDFTEDTNLSTYVSAAFMRPLTTEPIHGSPTYAGSYKTLAYGSAKPYSGNSAAGTLLVRLQTYGFAVEGFGNIGKITTKKGIETLISDYPYYRALPDFDASQNSALAWWAGGRLSYNGYGVHVMAEAIASQEQLIHRVGTYAQAGYSFDRDSDYFNHFELLVRYDALWTLDSTKTNDNGISLRTPDTNNAISWDHQIVTLAGKMHLIDDILALRLEYSFFLEKNDVPACNLANRSIDDNELLLQIEARY